MEAKSAFRIATELSTSRLVGLAGPWRCQVLLEMKNRIETV